MDYGEGAAQGQPGGTKPTASHKDKGGERSGGTAQTLNYLPVREITNDRLSRLRDAR